MELSCIPRRYHVESCARFSTTNLADESSVFEKDRCLSMMTKTCNGLHHPRLEDKKGFHHRIEAPLSLTEMPESFSNETNPPKNGSHCAALFNGHRNGFKHAALGNGFVNYEMTTCNGFHHTEGDGTRFHRTEGNGTRPEKTVGHGRPRCQSQPDRLLSWSESSSVDYGETTVHRIHNEMNPEHMAAYILDGTSDASADTKDFSFMTMDVDDDVIWVDGMPQTTPRDRDLYQTSRPTSAFRGFIPRRQSNGTVDQHLSHCPTLYRNRSFPDSKQELKIHLQEGMQTRGHSKNFARRFEVASESKFESKFHLNGWTHDASCIPETSLEDEFNLENASRIFSLLQNNGPMTSLQIAKFIGLETKSQVNPCLYHLHKNDLVKIGNSIPPVWGICEQFVNECLSGPGVIGAERRNEKYVRRRSHGGEFPEHPRRHSYNTCDNRIRKEPQAVDTPRPWVRSNGHCSSPGERAASNYCKLCRVPLLSEAQFEEHLRSTKHQNRKAKINAVPYKKFCEYCKVHLNSESQAKEHFTSGRHEQTVAKSQKAPPKQHFPLVTVSEEVNLQRSTKTEPYVYQLELYSKAMKANTVCFLPTGTGKTLVAALVIERMLKLNPSRQVVFLVDRVLLVLQQSDYLRNELANIRVPDDDSSNSFNGTRPIRIGAVCGEMRKLKGNARIYEQDVLIITADCYRNHLNNGTLRFDDVSLIVLDEAHHCNKDHPYNVIIRDFYFREDDLLGHRPKVLGLTASPAGEISLDKTTKRIQRLLGNLGDAKLVTVTDNAQELAEKTNKAPPDCITASYTHSEKELMEVFMEYVTKAFNMTVRLSEMKDYKDIFQPSSGGQFSIEDIYPVLRVIDNIVRSRPESNALSSLLHFQFICEAVCALQECGEKIALYQMAELTEEGCPHGFHWAEKMGLPCSRLWLYLGQYLRKGSPWDSEFAGVASGVEQLIKLLLKANWSGACGRTNGCVLVLVNRRITARYLATYLSNNRELLLRNVQTTYIGRHGDGSDDEETAVLRNRDVMSQITDGYFQVVVATNVSEEGLDLPGCQLVVQMNPAGSAPALVQMRGRARFKDTRFVSICRNDEQAKKIEDLLKREENMKRAARIINGL